MSRIGIKQYQSFIAVAQELHFGRGAEKLVMTQPAISRFRACSAEVLSGAPEVGATWELVVVNFVVLEFVVVTLWLQFLASTFLHCGVW